MRVLALLAAVLGLVAIGTAEALESVGQLSDLPGRGLPSVSPRGTVLTGAAFVASVAVYAIVGWSTARAGLRERDAVRAGAIVGSLAGLIGGAIRAYLVADYLSYQPARYGFGNEVLWPSLVVYAVLAIVASAAGGGAITWLSFRLARPRSPRPQP